MRVLYFEKTKSVRDSYSIYLDNMPFAIASDVFGSLEKAMGMAESGATYDLIIASHIEEQSEGPRFYAAIRERFPVTPLLMIIDETSANLAEVGQMKKDGGNNFFVDYSSGRDGFTKEVVSILKDNIDVNFEYEEAQYHKVRIVYFLRFNKVLCDVYIKLSDDKYVKVLRKGDAYSREDLKKYIDKKVTHLYIGREDADEFNVSLAKMPFLIQDKNLDPGKVEDASVATIEILHSLVQEVGINEEVVNLVDYTVYQIDNAITQANDLSSMLNRMREKRDYIYDHSYMVAYIATNICMAMDWDSEEIRKKLSYAAIFHDITLSDPQLAMAVDLHLPELVNFSEEQINAYKNHPQMIAEMIREYDEIPPNVDEIIANHHESPEEKGFPRGLGPHRIPQLAALFIVAHAFVNELYRENFDSSKTKIILDRMKERFSVGNFQGPLDGLLHSFDMALKNS